MMTPRISLGFVRFALQQGASSHGAYLILSPLFAIINRDTVNDPDNHKRFLLTSFKCDYPGQSLQAHPAVNHAIYRLKTQAEFVSHDENASLSQT